MTSKRKKLALAIGGGLALAVAGATAYLLSPHNPPESQATPASQGRQMSIEDVVVETCNPGGYTDGYGSLHGNPISRAICVDPVHGEGQIHYGIYASEFEALNAVAQIRKVYTWYILEPISSGNFFVMVSPDPDSLHPFDAIPSANI